MSAARRIAQEQAAPRELRQVEGRLDNVFSDKGFIQSDQVQVIPVTFGIVF